MKKSIFGGTLIIPIKKNIIEYSNTIHQEFQDKFMNLLFEGFLIVGLDKNENNIIISLKNFYERPADNKIYTTVGLDVSGMYHTNGVTSERLLMHLYQNLIDDIKSKRIIFIDGVCVYNEQMIEKLQENPVNKNTVEFVKSIRMNQDTKPYV